VGDPLVHAFDQPGARVLDRLRLNFPHIVRNQDLGYLWAFDLSAPMLEKAAGKLAAIPALHERSCTVQGNAEDYTVPDADAVGGPPTVITYAYSLSMIPDWEASVRCSWKQLEPGGTMMVLDFGDFRGWPGLGRLMHGYLKYNHVRHFNAPWVELLDELGAQVDHREKWGRYSVVTYAHKPAGPTAASAAGDDD
jgi:ubiquinone/menaquinone biosynthesis C-methylase UbiE